MDTEKTTNIDKITFNNLQIGQDNLKDELLEMTESLVPPPQVMETSGNTAENTNREEIMEAEKRLQREKEKYEMLNRKYMGQLSDEENSDMYRNDMGYTYFG